MMSQQQFRHRSFLLGVILASFTWAAAVYLYWKISNNSGPNVSSLAGDSYVPLRERLGFEGIKGNNNDYKQRSFFGNSVKSSGGKFFGLKVHDESTNSDEKKDWISNKKLKTTAHKNSDILVNHLKSAVSVVRDVENIEGSDVGLVKTLTEKQTRTEGYKRYAFNALISSRLGAYRNVTDTRHPRLVILNFMV